MARGRLWIRPGEQEAIFFHADGEEFKEILIPLAKTGGKSPGIYKCDYPSLRIGVQVRDLRKDLAAMEDKVARHHGPPDQWSKRDATLVRIIRRLLARIAPDGTPGQ